MSPMSEHALLEPPSPAYTNVTVRRAFIVWLHCGQTNKFKDVCNYFHFLEELEDKLSAERRAISRRHEFDLFSNPPPSSPYLSTHYPKLYTRTQPEHYYVTKLEAIRNEKCVFKLEGFEDIALTHGVTKHDIIETSQLIRRHCLSHNVTLKKFLKEFKEYTAKCLLKNTVHNVASYIKRQMIKDEITMISNCPKTFNFLEDEVDLDIHESINFLNSQRRLLDSINLSPTMKMKSLDPWSDDNLRSKVLNAKNGVVKKMQKHHVKHKEVIRVDVYVNGLNQKYKTGLVFSV